MAEELIAEYRWRLPVEEWSVLCDNTLKLDRSTGFSDGPMRKNSVSICAPKCEMCVTPFGKALEKPCSWPRVPSKWNVTLNGAFNGLQGWSACASSMGGSFVGRYISNAAAANGRKICWWGTERTKPGVIFGNLILEPDSGIPCKIIPNQIAYQIFVDGTPESKVLRLSFSAAAYGRELTGIVGASVQVFYRLDIGNAAPFGRFEIPFSSVSPDRVPDPTFIGRTAPIRNVISWPESITVQTEPFADPG